MNDNNVIATCIFFAIILVAFTVGILSIEFGSVNATEITYCQTQCKDLGGLFKIYGDGDCKCKK